VADVVSNTGPLIALAQIDQVLRDAGESDDTALSAPCNSQRLLAPLIRHDSVVMKKDLGCKMGCKMARRHTIQAVIHPGDESGYVAECVDLAVVTQGRTLDETVQNLREALQLHLEGEDLAEIGLASDPPLLVTMELEPVHA